MSSHLRRTVYGVGRTRRGNGQGIHIRSKYVSGYIHNIHTFCLYLHSLLFIHTICQHPLSICRQSIDIGVCRSRDAQWVETSAHHQSMSVDYPQMIEKHRQITYRCWAEVSPRHIGRQFWDCRPSLTDHLNHGFQTNNIDIQLFSDDDSIIKYQILLDVGR
jgi:hypothetical protein